MVSQKLLVSGRVPCRDAKERTPSPDRTGPVRTGPQFLSGQRAGEIGVHDGSRRPSHADVLPSPDCVSRQMMKAQEASWAFIIGVSDGT